MNIIHVIDIDNFTAVKDEISELQRYWDYRFMSTLLCDILLEVKWYRIYLYSSQETELIEYRNTYAADSLRNCSGSLRDVVNEENAVLENRSNALMKKKIPKCLRRYAAMRLVNRTYTDFYFSFFTEKNDNQHTNILTELFSLAASAIDPVFFIQADRRDIYSYCCTLAKKADGIGEALIKRGIDICAGIIPEQNTADRITSLDDSVQKLNDRLEAAEQQSLDALERTTDINEMVDELVKKSIVYSTTEKKKMFRALSENECFKDVCRNLPRFEDDMKLLIMDNYIYYEDGLLKSRDTSKFPVYCFDSYFRDTQINTTDCYKAVTDTMGKLIGKKKLYEVNNHTDTGTIMWDKNIRNLLFEKNMHSKKVE